MIKIIEKEVKIVKEYDVEPKVVTLYYVNPLDKDIVEYKNCIFKEAIPVIYGASGANDYYLEYENGKLFRSVLVDIKTGIVKNDSQYFFDYEQAVRAHQKIRIEFLKNRIDDLKDRATMLKEIEKELKELEK